MLSSLPGHRAVAYGFRVSSLMAGQSLEANFPDAWQEFRTWRVLHWISWIAFIVVSGICIAFDYKSTNFPFWPDGMVIFGCLAFVAFSRAKLRNIRCPRCHRNFFPWLRLFPIFL